MKKIKIIILGTLLLSVSGCAVIQSNKFENMSPYERSSLLKERTTGELCNAYMHPWAKEKTLHEIKSILTSRGVETCYKGADEKVVYAKPEPPAESKKTILQGSSEGQSSLLAQSTVLPATPSMNEVAEIKPVMITKLPSIDTSIQPVFVDEWKEIIGGTDNAKNIDYLDQLALTYSNKATVSNDSGNNKEAAENILRVLAISLHRNKIKKNYSTDRVVAATKTFLSSKDVKQPVIDKTVSSLEIAYPYTPPKPLTARRATSGELSLLKSAVKSTLLDPTSPIFGDAIMIGNNRACIDVNGKNAYGGYVGKTAWNMRKENGKWRGYSMRSTTLDYCTDFIINPPY